MPGIRRRLLASLLVAVGVAGAAGCAEAEADQPASLTLATGADGAIFRELGAAIAAVADEEDDAPGIEVLHTEAAVENADLLRSGEVDLGFVNADVVDAERDRIAGLVRVFDSVLHVVVPEASSVGSMEDLDGLVVAGGHPRSGTRHTAEIAIDALGLDVELVDASQREAVDALADGSVDAVLSLTAYPTPALVELADRMPVRLIDVQDVADRIVAERPDAYLTVTIPSTTYEGVGTVSALAVPSVLAARADLDDDTAYAVTDLVLERSADLAATRPEAEQINARTGSATAPIVLHDAAVRWYREHKP